MIKSTYLAQFFSVSALFFSKKKKELELRELLETAIIFWVVL
jgi:hypothetical protein